MARMKRNNGTSNFDKKVAKIKSMKGEQKVQALATWIKKEYPKQAKQINQARNASAYVNAFVGDVVMEGSLPDYFSPRLVDRAASKVALERYKTAKGGVKGRVAPKKK